MTGRSLTAFYLSSTVEPVFETMAGGGTDVQLLQNTVPDLVAAARDNDLVWWIWAVILAGSLLTIIGLARAGSEIFWKSHDASHIREAEPERPVDDSQPPPEEPAPNAPMLPFIACFGLLAGLVLLTVFAGPMMDYTNATAAQLFDPNLYIDAVLRRAEP